MLCLRFCCQKKVFSNYNKMLWNHKLQNYYKRFIFNLNSSEQLEISVPRPKNQAHSNFAEASILWWEEASILWWGGMNPCYSVNQGFGGNPGLVGGSQQQKPQGPQGTFQPVINQQPQNLYGGLPKNLDLSTNIQANAPQERKPFDTWMTCWNWRARITPEDRRLLCRAKYCQH